MAQQRARRMNASGEGRHVTPRMGQTGSSGHARTPHYNFGELEAKWRARWEASGLYRPDLERAARPYYNLMMFPYPSAEGLHIGNVFTYVGVDVHGRWRALQGYDVFEPIGFDAFGIHSENFALKQGVHPALLTARNVARFRETQLKLIGNRFDWSHELNTSEPSYYRWTQWIFVQLFKAGLAERRSASVNWCPHDKTVLADEQVIDGRCERCGTLVERREMRSWMLKITRYADRLLTNLDRLDWPEQVKAAQRNWIGRSEGLAFEMPVAGVPDAAIAVYTTHAETVYGVTFVALAPEHPLIARITQPERANAVGEYVARVRSRALATEQSGDARGQSEASGVFTGAYAVLPLTGEHVPIWVADYVLMEHGTGAIMGVPAHDARDLAFARAMGLPVRRVVIPDNQEGEEALPKDEPDEAYTVPGRLVDSGEWSGMPSAEARATISARFEQRGWGRRSVHYHLRDWNISRQRYWGPPIPIIYCPEHGAVPVPEEQLPVLLPDVQDYQPSGTGDSPLANMPDFVATTCPICGKPARRETDVSDNFLDSAWYYLRYPSSGDERQPWNPELTRKWLPVTMYIGGAEHAVLHLLYARFICMALHDLGHLHFEEPFPRFEQNGLLTLDGAKISKSVGNVINPDEYLARYGADALRTYLMFMGPFQEGGDFTDAGLGGVIRFLDRLWQLIPHEDGLGEPIDAAAHAALQRTVERVTDSLASLKYNTAVAALMAHLNEMETRRSVSREEREVFLVLLAPFAPFLTEELWERLGHADSVHAQRWPTVDEAALRAQPLTLIVQVDGRLRDRLTVAPATPASTIEELALSSATVRRALGERSVQRFVHVPGRVLNIVTHESGAGADG